MKKIEIQQESGNLKIFDMDDNDISTYSKELSKLMESSKICILETSSGNIIIKPSKIISIFVSEVDEEEKISGNKKLVKIKEDVLRD